MIEQAQRDKGAAEEARLATEREAPKIADATKEAEEARRARQEAEQRLAQIRGDISAQEARQHAPAQATAQTYDDANAAANRGDYSAALRIIRPLADRGNAKAQGFLGLMYAEGWGVPQDYGEATKWYRRGANEGDYYSEVSLGLMYRDGRGVPQDYIHAYLWLNLAAQSNEPADVPGHHTPAQIAAMGRDYVARLMTTAQIAEAQRLASEWKPER